MCSHIKILIIVLCASLFSCDATPDLESNNGGLHQSRAISISYLKSLYTSIPVVIDEQVHITGRVISSDRYGNIYKSLFVEDATGGVEIRLDDDELYKRFNRGDMVVVRCNSLWLGSYGGSIILGASSADGLYEVDPIPEKNIDNVVIQEGDSQEPLPTIVKISELEHRLIDCWVHVDGVQFIDQQLGLSWSDSDANSDRHLVDIMGDTLIVRSNHNALFASYSLPLGSGRVRAILGYFNNSYQLLMISPHDAVMEQERFVVERRISPPSQSRD